MDAFGKSPWENDLNHKISSFSIRQLKSNIGFHL
jgi:DNA-binding CsgD family transcriptional regulator